MIRVLVADDHLLVRKGTMEMISEFDDIEVVGEAKNGQEAVDKVPLLHPDIVLMDLNMPVMDGIEATKTLKAKYPNVGVISLSAHDEEHEILKALQSGANGYLLKTATEEELAEAIRLVSKGRPALLQPEVTRAMLGKIQSHEELTAREIEILKYLAKDLGNKQIGATLGISERTVQQHLSNIYGKLNVTSRTGAALRALHLGYLTLEDACL